MFVRTRRLRRIGRRFLPVMAVIAVTVGLSCAVLDRTPASAMPAPSQSASTHFDLAPTALQKARWNARHTVLTAEDGTETATARMIGVGALALGLAGAFGIVLMMFDQMMRNRPRQDRKS